MLRWPDYFADPPSDTTSGDVNVFPLLSEFSEPGESPEIWFEPPTDQKVGGSNPSARTTVMFRVIVDS